MVRVFGLQLRRAEQLLTERVLAPKITYLSAMKPWQTAERPAIEQEKRDRRPHRTRFAIGLLHVSCGFSAPSPPPKTQLDPPTDSAASRG